MDYAATATRVAELIKRAGVPVTLSRARPGVYNRRTSSTEDAGTLTTNGSGVRAEFQFSEIDGTRIRRGDVRLYLSIATPPETGDTITMLGEAWTVIVPRPIQPGAIALLYEVQVRKP